MKSVYGEEGDTVEIKWAWENINDDPLITVYELVGISMVEVGSSDVTIGQHSVTITKTNIGVDTPIKFKVEAVVDGKNFTEEASLYIICRFFRYLIG